MPAVKWLAARDVFLPEQLAQLTQVSPWRGLAHVAHCWAVILITLGACVLWPHPLVWLVALPVLGGRQLGLAILMHEAAHGLLHPHHGLNDAVGKWLCAAPSLTDMNAYRAYHLRHHKYTQQPEDPDLGLSAPFPVTRASLRRKVVRDLTGQTFLRQIRAMAAAGWGDAAHAAALPFGGRASARASLLRFALVTVVISAVFSISGAAWAGLIWLAAFASFFQLFLRVRNIAEHACTATGSGDDPFAHARTTRANALERAFVAPYNVNFHAEHHLFMNLPCRNLPTVHQLLGTLGYHPRMTIAPGYGAVLRQVTRAGVSAQ